MDRKNPILKLILTIVILICGMAFTMGTGGGGGGGPVPGGTVGGAIFTGQGNVLDGDTNDPMNPVIDNNSINNPQSVQIPATIGGYASNVGNNFFIFDPVDIYKVRLNGPVTIVLAIADSNNSDLDLYLTDLNGVDIAVPSTGTGPFEMIETDQNGDFLIRVEAFSGATNYVLSLGVSTSSNAAVTQLLGDALMANAEFVSDEIIIKPAAGHSTAQAQSTMAAMAAYFGMEQVVSTLSPSGPYLMQVSHAVPSPYMVQRSRDNKPPGLAYSSEEQQQRAQTLEIIKLLRKHPSIAYAEPNYIYHINRVPNDDFYDLQWHYGTINLPQAWEITTGDDAVVVGVIDTGVLLNHPDLTDRILRDGSNNIIGYDFISDPTRANDGDGIDPNPDDSGDSGFTGARSSFHGSHVAGTIGAATDNTIGVAGVTWAGKIMPLRVLGVGGGTSFDIAQAILYAAQNPANASGEVPPVKANIINLSLGPSNENCAALPAIGTTLKNAVETALAANVIVVAAAGNDNCDVPSPLSTVPGVISVSAVDLLRQKAPYSNFGSTVDVAAPGGNSSVDLNADGQRDGVYSTVADDSLVPTNPIKYGYAFYQGTSMAAPHAAGVFALMLAVNDTLTPTDINQLLAGTHPNQLLPPADPAHVGPITQDIGTPGRDDQFGYGLIDAFQAVNVASIIGGGSPITGPALTVFPTPLSFSYTSTVLDLTLSNPGTEDLIIDSITPDAPWLSVTLPTGLALPATVIPGNPNAIDIEVVVDRSGLNDGAFLGSITIISNAAGSPSTVPVSMQVQANVGGDVGEVYVLVVDPKTFDTVNQTNISAADGYVYRTPRVPAGTYFIAAGTDHNNDGSVCDAGEACGIYRLIDNPIEITVEVDIDKSQIDFPVFYDFFASNTAAQIFGSGDLPLTGFRRLDYKRIK